MACTWHVAPGGSEQGDGSKRSPWSLRHALKGAGGSINAGDVVLLRGGSYPSRPENRVTVRGEPGRSITFAAYPGETPLIDAAIGDFQRPRSDAWEKQPGPHGVNVYRSRRSFTFPGQAWCGGFISLDGRLHSLAVHRKLSYLQSPDDLWKDDGSHYLGPGLWTEAGAPGRIYIRLDNASGEAQRNRPDVTQIPHPDPGMYELHISDSASRGLLIEGSHLRFEKIHFRGHWACWWLTPPQTPPQTDLRFIDCVGEPLYVVARLGEKVNATNIKILGGRYSAHMPTGNWWLSYADIKKVNDPPAGRLRKFAFDLGNASDVELGPSPDGTRMIVRQFFDGILATGPLRDIEVHGVWFDDIWDDAWQQFTNISNVNYHDNVHFGAGPGRQGTPAKPNGTIYIHDNIIDTTRRRVMWQRGGHPGDEKPPVREPIAFNSHNSPLATQPAHPWKLYHNTVVKGALDSKHSLGCGQFGSNRQPDQARHEVYNNIFVALDGRPLDIDFWATSGLEIYDGNCLWSNGTWTPPERVPYRLVHSSTDPNGKPVASPEQMRRSQAYEDSKKYYRAGWENSAIETDPKLDDRYVAQAEQARTGAVDISDKPWPATSPPRAQRGAMLTAPFPPARYAVPRLVDRSAQWQTPPATGAPTAIARPQLGDHVIAYRDRSGHLRELWRDAAGQTGTSDLTAIAGAARCAGSPFFYVDASNLLVLCYRGTDRDIHSLYWTTGSVRHDDLTGSISAPKATGSPVGWFDCARHEHHVAYRSAHGHLHELWWTGSEPVGHGDLTSAASAPRAAGNPSAYLDSARGVHIVVYRAADGHIRSLYWTTGDVSHEDLSATAGTPLAAGDPFAYYSPHDDIHQVVYRARNGHLYELSWEGVQPVTGRNLTEVSRAPRATGVACAYFSAATNTKHVVYRSRDGRLHDISWTPGDGTPSQLELTAFANAPAAADRPVAFTIDGAGTQHVAYRATDNHIYEIRW